MKKAVFLRQYRTKIVRELRRQIFRQIVQIERRRADARQANFVQYGGKDASKARTKSKRWSLCGVALIAMFGAMLLSGCSNAAEVTLDGSTAAIPSAGIAIEFPADYDIVIGDEVYKTLGGAISDGTAVEELKAEYEENGIRYLISAQCGSEIIVVSAQNMTPDEDTERTTLEDYARQVHDTTIFEYYASGYRTTGNTSLSEASYGGKDGWVSFFEVTTAPADGEEPQFLIGYIEFMFECGDDIYCVQLGLQQQTDRETAAQSFEMIKVYP